MLSALSDVFVAIFQLLVDMTVWLGDLVARPVRFLFSRHYRAATRQNWHLHPVRAWFQFIGGSVVLILFAAMISLWAFLLVAAAQEPTPGEEKEIKDLKGRIIEKIRRHRKEKPKASNHAMERTATRRALVLGMSGTLPFHATLALGGRRSSYSR